MTTELERVLFERAPSELERMMLMQGYLDGRSAVKSDEQHPAYLRGRRVAENDEVLPAELLQQLREDVGVSDSISEEEQSLANIAYKDISHAFRLVSNRVGSEAAFVGYVALLAEIVSVMQDPRQVKGEVMKVIDLAIEALEPG